MGISLTDHVDSSNRIDSEAVGGLSSVYNSLAYRVAEIERHFHGRERWWGALAAPDETNAIEANVTRPYVAASGADTWGVAIPVVGTDDAPAQAADVYFDVHRLMIVDLDDETDPWRIRLIYGTGTSAAAIGAGQWTEMIVESNAVPGNRAGASPVEVMMPRVAAGTKLWAQVWNNTNLEELSFFVGVHGYEG